MSQLANYLYPNLQYSPFVFSICFLFLHALLMRVRYTFNARQHSFDSFVLKESQMKSYVVFNHENKMLKEHV